MKIYVLIPSYNDASSIKFTLDSIMMQTYKNYEVVIVDDGSTDNTKEVVRKYKEKNDKDNKIKYIYQENKDQLNALINASNYIKDKNSLVYILHSDDILDNKNVFSNAIDYMKNNNYDAIISSAKTIDINNNITGIQEVKKYVNKKYILPLELLWLGRNLYIDTAFYKSEVFIKNVYNNYLTWNGPFWLNLDTNDILNVKKVDFNFFKYRVFEGNYINNKLGKLCVINGELRVVTRLLKYYYLPFYKLQYIIYRIFNKIKLQYRPIYLNKETKNKYSVIKFVLNKRFNDEEIKDNMYLSSILNFYKNYKNRTIKIEQIDKNTKIYHGSDMRIFNKKLLDNSLDSIYLNIFKEMNKGFNKIIVKTKKDKEIMDTIIRFLSIYPYVEIDIKK